MGLVPTATTCAAVAVARLAGGRQAKLGASFRFQIFTFPDACALPVSVAAMTTPSPTAATAC